MLNRLFKSWLTVRECGASGCYPPLCLPCSPPLWVRPSWFICTNVGLQGLPVVRLPALFIPLSTSLSPARATRVLSSPAARLRPSYRSGCMFIFLFTWCRTSLLFDFPSVLVVRGGAVCPPTPPSWFSSTSSILKDRNPIWKTDWEGKKHWSGGYLLI